MNRRLIAASLAVAFACACATGQAGKEPTSKSEQQRINNLGHFDVATCELTPPTVPDKVTTEVMLGLLVAARPQIMECLVDPKARGAAKDTKVVVDSTLGDSGVQTKVTGENLTPDGTQCIQAALDKWFKATGITGKAAFVPPPAPVAKGAPPAPAPGPVTGHVEFQHVAGINPAVTMGQNDANDVVGTIRLAEGSWCDCFADWKSTAPRALKGSVKVSRSPAGTAAKDNKDKKDDKTQAAAGSELVSPSEVTFEPANDPAADKVAACLKGKIMALKFKAPTSDYITIPYPFRFVHSGTSEALPGATPDLQFVQYDLERGQTTARAAIAVGARTEAVSTYDMLVQTYKAAVANKKTPQKKLDELVSELKSKCKALVEADDKVTETMKNELAVEEATHQFAVEQKAKDPAWAEAETASAAQVTASQKSLEDSQATRKRDEGVCPKEHY